MALKVKIRGDGDLLIPYDKGEQVMCALAVIIDSIEDANVGDQALTSEAIAALAYHANNPGLKIDSRFVAAIENIKGGVMQGGQICQTLFGLNYLRDMQSGGVTMPDPEVRAVVAAARPKIHISIRHPFDVTHESTLTHECSERRRATRKFHDQNFVVVEAGDTSRVSPNRPGQDWRGLVRQQSDDFVHQWVRDASDGRSGERNR